MAKILPPPEGLTLDAISRRFSDEKAREYLESVRWEKGRFCPHCGNSDQKRLYAITANRKKEVRDGLYECAECKKQFTVTVGTIFEDTHIPLRKWLVAWYLLCASKKGISAAQIHRMLGLGSYRTAWSLMHRIRYALRDSSFSDKLSGTFEADETFIGDTVHGKMRVFRGSKTPIVTLTEPQKLGDFQLRYKKRKTADGDRVILGFSRAGTKRRMVRRPKAAARA